jgi:hypothetical protein
MIEHEDFLADGTCRPAEMLDHTGAIVWREVRAGRPLDAWRPNLQRACLAQADFLDARSDVDFVDTARFGEPACVVRGRSGAQRRPVIAQSHIRPLVRDQLTLLCSESGARQERPGAVTRD